MTAMARKSRIGSALLIVAATQVSSAQQAATPEDIEAMRQLLREALDAGAAGFSTGRSDNHRTSRGEETPASEASAAELTGIARAFDGLGHGVVQVVSDFYVLRGPPRSRATTSAAFFSQCGSSNCFFSKWPPTRSNHCGSMLAMPRPNSRVVSTSSATTIQRPGFLLRCAPGCR